MYPVILDPWLLTILSFLRNHRTKSSVIVIPFQDDTFFFKNSSRILLTKEDSKKCDQCYANEILGLALFHVCFIVQNRILRSITSLVCLFVIGCSFKFLHSGMKNPDKLLNPRRLYSFEIGF